MDRIRGGSCPPRAPPLRSFFFVGTDTLKDRGRLSAASFLSCFIQRSALQVLRIERAGSMRPTAARCRSSTPTSATPSPSPRPSSPRATCSAACCSWPRTATALPARRSASSRRLCRASSASRWRAERAEQKKASERMRALTLFRYGMKKAPGRPRRPFAARAADMDTCPVRCRPASRSL